MSRVEDLHPLVDLYRQDPDALSGLRRTLIREIGYRTGDPDLSAISSSGLEEDFARTLEREQLIEALQVVNRAFREVSRESWDDVTPEVQLLLGISPRDQAGIVDDEATEASVTSWWVSPSGSTQFTSVEEAARASRGLLTTQVVQIGANGPINLESHIRLAANALDSFGCTHPSIDSLRTWIDATLRNTRPSAIRLDVGLGLPDSLNARAGVPFAAISGAQHCPRLSRRISVSLFKDPIEVFAPLAGIPLSRTAERSIALRSAAREGAQEALLFSHRGKIVDMCRSSAFLFDHLTRRWLTPSVDKGARDSVYRQIAINRLGASERGDLTWTDVARGSLYVVGEDGSVAIASRAALTRLETSADLEEGAADLERAFREALEV